MGVDPLQVGRHIGSLLPLAHHPPGGGSGVVSGDVLAKKPLHRLGQRVHALCPLPPEKEQNRVALWPGPAVPTPLPDDARP
jgi:hypothetical protein